MDRRDNRIIFEQFQRIGRECRAFRRDDVRTHFWELMEQEYQAKTFPNPYKFMPVQKDQIKNLFREELKDSKHLAAQKIRQERRLIYQFATLIHEKLDAIEGEPFACRLERLETLDGLDEKILLEMQNNAKEINQERALQIIEIWRGNNFLADDPGEGLRHEEILIAKLLGQIDRIFQDSFLESMTGLIDFLLHPSKEIEIICSEIPEYEGFLHWVGLNKQDLAENHWDVGHYGEKQAPRIFLEKFAKTFFLRVERKAKVSGKEDGKQIAVLRKKDLLDYYKRKKVVINGRTDEERKRELRQIVIRKKAKGERLSRSEKAFYETIGDRIILRKNEIVPQAVYQRLMDLTIPEDSILIDECLSHP